MSNHEEEYKPPLLLQLWSKHSEFSDLDLDKFEHGQLKKLYVIQIIFFFFCSNSIIDATPLQDPRGYQQPIQVLPSPQSEESPQAKWIPCSCTKTHCLKMYCSCFHNNRYCNDQCKCEECQNKEDYVQERQKALTHVIKKAHRNKKVAQDKLFETAKVWGCNCKKTRCKKRYCECYIRNQKCTVECNCDECENGKDEDLYNEIKRMSEKPVRSKRVRSQKV